MPDGECGCGWFCGLLNEETVQPVANATVDTPLQHGITRDFSDCGRCVNWMFENRIVCQCNDGYTQVDIEGEDLDICCLTVNVCGEAENKVCCEEEEVCAEDKCCLEIKACGMGVDRVCCGEMEECVGGVCCPSEKKCGETCCGAEQTCENGQCKCPTGKPKKCGESCCLIGCNSTNTGCKCPDCETECGSICCGVNETCPNGVCVCKDGREACAGVCCSEKRECHKGTTCCDIIDKTKCPNGETMIASDGCEICKCDTGAPDVCPEETVRVKNYTGDIVCGEVCCRVEAGSAFNYVDPTTGDHWSSLASGYTVSGAINGGCCGGWSFVESDNNGPINGSYRSYSILVNSGGAYCGMSANSYEILGRFTNTSSSWYIDSTRYCYEYDSPTYETSGSGCSCSDSGDPRNGSPCN